MTLATDQRTHAQGLRFVLAGALNTAATYALFLVLLRWFHYSVAYSVVYVAGIGLSYVLNCVYVFRVPLHWKNFVVFPVVYLAQYLVGLAVLYVAVDVAGLPRAAAMLIAIAVSIPLTFVLSRRVLRPGTVASAPSSPIVPEQRSDYR